MTTPIKSGITVLLLLLTASLFAQNNALHFDGTDDFITRPLGISVNGTWEAWVQKENWADHHDDRLFSNGIYLENEGAFYVSLHPAVGLHFRIGGTKQQGNGYLASALTKDFAPNSWHHLAITWAFGKINTLCLYVDGVKVATSTDINPMSLSKTFIAASSTTFIGGDPVSPKFGAGAIDEVRIWDVARTPEQIAANYKLALPYPQANLIAYLNFNNSNAAGTNNNTLPDLINPAMVYKLNGFALNGPSSNFIKSTVPLSYANISMPVPTEASSAVVITPVSTPAPVQDLSSSSIAPFIGEIKLFAGNYAPKDWALCDGSELQIISNTALFSIISTTYGGDGRTTFNLPDLRTNTATPAGVKLNYIICVKGNFPARQ